MDDLTPEQKKQLKTWAFQRDGALRRIEILTEEQKKLEERNHNLSSSSTEIETRINISLGRLKELEKKEEEFKNLLHTDTAHLMVEYSKLQTEIPALKTEIEHLKSKKQVIVDFSDSLIQVFERILGRTEGLEKIITGITSNGEKNIKEVVVLMNLLGKSVQELVDKNAKNVESTNIILEKLPRYIFELQKPIPIRRPIVGPVARQNLEIKPEKK